MVMMNRCAIAILLGASLVLPISAIAQTPAAPLSPTPAPSDLPTPDATPAHSIWKRFTSLEGNFSVLMPGDPQQTQKTQATVKGNLVSTLFVVERPEATYIVSYTDFPAGVVNAANTNKLFQSGRDAAVRQVQGKLLGERSLTLSGAPGREIQIEAPKGLIIRNRLYWLNQRMYQVMAVTRKDKDKYLTKSVAGFLDSFTFVPSNPEPSPSPTTSN